MRYFFFLTILVNFSPHTQAQTSFPFEVKEALVITAPQTYRMRNYEPDAIEHLLIDGKWETPVLGQPLSPRSDSVWKKLLADENGWFQDRSLRGSYVYVPIESGKKQVMILEGKSHQLVYVNGVPRVGNRYQYKDDFESWEPKFNFSQLPIELQKGTNHLLFKCNRGRFKASFSKPKPELFFNENDPTLPDLIAEKAIDSWGAMVLTNATLQDQKNLVIISSLGEGKPSSHPLPFLGAASIQKIAFRIKSTSPSTSKISNTLFLSVTDKNGKVLAEMETLLRVVQPYENHRRTYRSSVDGSVQYYSILPASTPGNNKALVLSVHGANVEALNQSGSYYAKPWTNIVSPTNRRPYGYNWEDWGRMDAIDVLNITQQDLNADPNRIYLTGHSMGGHGTWILGATYPDRFAAIGPSAGWVSFWSYRVRTGEKPDSNLDLMMMRAANISQTDTLASNYTNQGVYILHGGADRVVKPSQARHMDTLLSGFHHDYIYHEEPGQGHWWDLSDENGADCVDWPPMFDFFARHARPEKERIRQVKFVTANPGISSTCYWAGVYDQESPLAFSKINLRLDPGKNRISGTLENVKVLSLDPSVLDTDRKLMLAINGDTSEVDISPNEEWIYFEKDDSGWKNIRRPSRKHKGPHRYGTFKDAFRNRALLVYGTAGTPEENKWAKEKARYDSETFWYQGNGRLEILPDTEFDPSKDPNRNVILYGNASTNTAWSVLLSDSPVTSTKGKMTVGNQKIKGKDLSSLFIRPRSGSPTASIGVVTGTTLTGMKRLNSVPYLYAGFGFPDMIVLSKEGLIGAGFFGRDWKVDGGDFVWDY